VIIKVREFIFHVLQYGIFL